MKIVFDEFYGTLSYAQRAAYRKHNVSPSDHDALLERFFINDHEAITKYVKWNASNNKGMFNFFDINKDIVHGLI